MKALKTSVAALAIAAALPAAAPAGSPEATIASALASLQRMALQYGVLFSRMFVDLTYDSIAVEPGTGDVILSGLRVYPELAWDPERACTVTVDRLLMADATSLERLGSAISLDGVTIRPACLQPDVGGLLAGFGYDGLTIENATIDIDYHIPSSSADLVLSASVADAAEIALTAHFDYLWFRIPLEDPADPQAAAAGAIPVARLGAAELAIRNDGLWQALAPMLAEQLGGDLSDLPQIVRMTLSEMLSEGGTRGLTPGETAFVEDLTAEIARFVQDPGRLVVTVAPDDGSVFLTEELTSSPAALIAALDPVVSSVPAAWRRMIPPAELAAALAGGEALDAGTRLRVGEALVTGIGAPRALAAGRALLAPLAEAWNADAALLAARADRATGDLRGAYTMALRAMAGGAAAALGLADDLEAEIELVEALNAQAEATNAWPGAEAAGAEADALLAAGDVSGIAGRARAAASGRGRPRDYAEAYYWASLAAAAGDRGAAALRDRLDARFEGQPGWAETVAAEQANALETWTSGLAGTIAAGVE